jgi:hypothetical protein
MKNSRLLCQKVKPELWRIRRRQSVRGSRHDFEMGQIRRFATTPPETRALITSRRSNQSQQRCTTQRQPEGSTKRQRASIEEDNPVAAFPGDITEVGGMPAQPAP